MLNAVSEGFDWVLLDSTPMLPMADATSLSRLCDGVLVVVREGHTRKRTLNRALASIEKNKQLGFIFNEASTVQIGYERYYGGYGYYGEKKSNADEGADTDSTARA
jgi:Mrp family chromosome partitioning ATPase